MRLAIFDLDNTLLAGDSDYLWGRYMVERGLVDAAHYEAENRRFYEQYQAGTLDIHAYSRFSMAPLARNEPDRLEALRQDFVATRIAPIIAAGARALLDEHRAAGAHLLITTATNRFVTEPIAELLGVDTLFATDLEVRDGRYTGKLTGIPNYQAGKVRRLRDWLAENAPDGHESWAYSDSHNDLALLEFAQHPHAVDPDPVLRQVALQRGWPVMSLREGTRA